MQNLDITEKKEAVKDLVYILKAYDTERGRWQYWIVKIPDLIELFYKL